LRKRKTIEERKKEVFFAIIQIIAEKGIFEVSTTEVAKKLNVSQPALYKYFKSKDDMFFYFLDELDKLLKEIIEKANQKEDVEEKLRTVFLEHISLVEKTKVLPRIIFSDVLFFGKNKEKLKNVVFSYQNGIEKIFEEGIEKGKIVDGTPPSLTRLFLGSILLSALNWILLDNSYSLKKDAEKSFETFIKAFLKE